MPSDSNHEPEGSKNPATPITYRIAGIPVDWDIARLQEFLRDINPAAPPVVNSLAKEAVAGWSTATVSFDAATTGIKLPRSGESTSVSLPLAVGRARATLDRDFLGMTTLFAPAPKDHEVE